MTTCTHRRKIKKTVWGDGLNSSVATGLRSNKTVPAISVA